MTIKFDEILLLRYPRTLPNARWDWPSSVGCMSLPLFLNYRAHTQTHDPKLRWYRCTFRFLSDESIYGVSRLMENKYPVTPNARMSGKTGLKATQRTETEFKYLFFSSAELKTIQPAVLAWNELFIQLHWLGTMPLFHKGRQKGIKWPKCNHAKESSGMLWKIRSVTFLPLVWIE